jgi:hypothetical protein
MEDIQYTLFIVYFRHKMQKISFNNQRNENIKELINKINILLDENTPEKIFKLEKRMLK